ncbi:MAG: hypothetical protein AB7S74_01885 [Hyphomicrobium sp.]
MNRNSLRTLGCEIRPFTREALAEFIPQEAAEDVFKKASAAILRQNIRPEHLRVQFSLRSDLFNAVQILITGPHAAPSDQPDRTNPRIGFFLATYPPRTDGRDPIECWREFGKPFGSAKYWSHMLDQEKDPEASTTATSE